MPLSGPYGSDIGDVLTSIATSSRRPSRWSPLEQRLHSRNCHLRRTIKKGPLDKIERPRRLKYACEGSLESPANLARERTESEQSLPLLCIPVGGRRVSQQEMGKVVSFARIFACALVLLLSATANAPAQEQLQLTGFQIVPNVINAAVSSDIRFVARIESVHGLVDEDDVKEEIEFVPSQIVYTSPLGDEKELFLLPSQNLMDGTRKRGNFVADLGMTRFATPGRWSIEFVLLVDVMGNQRYFFTEDLSSMGFDSSFVVSGTMADNSPPELMQVEVLNDRVVMNQTDGTLHVLIGIADDVSGLSRTSDARTPFSHVQYRCLNSPALQVVTGYIMPTENLMKGTVTAGVYNVSVSFPMWAMSGLWQLFHVFLSDDAGNTVTYDSRALVELGFPMNIHVSNVNLTYGGEDLFDYEEKLYDPYMLEEETEEDEEYYAY
eukprot:Opistho-2@67614